jgi:hypothetical protein
MPATTKRKPKTRIQDISATRTRRQASDMSVEELQVVEQRRRMTLDERKAYLKRRKMTVLHPDDVPFIAVPRDWKEGEDYIVDKRAKIRMADLGLSGDGEEEEE